MRSFVLGGVLGVFWIILSLIAYHRLFQVSQAPSKDYAQLHASMLPEVRNSASRGTNPHAGTGAEEHAQDALAASELAEAASADVHPKHALKQALSSPGEGSTWTGAAAEPRLRRKGVPVHPQGLTVWEAGVAWQSSPEGIRTVPGKTHLEVEPGAVDLLQGVAARMKADTGLGLIIVSRFASTEQEAQYASQQAERQVEGQTKAQLHAGTGALGDAGLARGDALRAELLGLGVMPNRCAVVSQMDDKGFAGGETPMDLLLVSKREALRSWSRSRTQAQDQDGSRRQGSTYSFVEHIRFPYGSSSLPEDPATLAPFRLLAEQLNQEPDLTVELTGHTCAISSAAFNQRLGKARAQAVADWLKAQGIAADRIAVRSAGESQPLADNADEQGQAANRRVEVRIR